MNISLGSRVVAALKVTVQYRRKRLGICYQTVYVSQVESLVSELVSDASVSRIKVLS
jgi:hypothetical protein